MRSVRRWLAKWFGYEMVLSYARENEKQADDLTDLLERWRRSVWVDRSRIRGGDEYKVKIGKAIQRCDQLVLLGSKDAWNSKSVEDEVLIAKSLGKRIVLVRLDTTTVPRQIFDTETNHYIDYYEASEKKINIAELERNFKKATLLDVIKALALTPPSPRAIRIVTWMAIVVTVAAGAFVTYRATRPPFLVEAIGEGKCRVLLNETRARLLGDEANFNTAFLVNNNTSETLFVEKNQFVIYAGTPAWIPYQSGKDAKWKVSCDGKVEPFP